MSTKVKVGLAVVLMGLFAGFLFGGGADSEADISAVIEKGALVVDVRTPGEFAGGHAEGAVNIPYDSISREIGSYVSDRGQAIVLYCHSGSRAKAAKQSLLQSGYTNVVNAATLRNMRKILGR